MPDRLGGSAALSGIVHPVQLHAGGSSSDFARSAMRDGAFAGLVSANLARSTRAIRAILITCLL